MIPVERLKSIPIFTELDAEELARLAPLFHHAHFNIGEIITRQGDPGDAFFVLVSGTLRIRYIDARDQERILGYLNAPSFFGETSLFTGVQRDVTIDVFSNDAELLVLSRDEFAEALKQYPKIKEDLIVRPDIQKKLAQRLFPWLSSGEIVLVNTRRHWYALVSRLPLPVIIFVVLVGVGFLSNALDPTASNPSAQANLFTYASTIFLIAGLLWGLGAGAWIGVDWSNDYYIVTNKRVIHIEKVIFFFDEREEALIEQITNVIEVGEGWAQRVFGFADLRVETAGRQIDVNFTFAPRSRRIPQVIFEQINRLRDRVALEKRERVRAGIREEIWNRLAPDVRGGKPPEPKPVAPTSASTTIAAAVPASRPTRRFRFTAVGERLNELFGLKIETPRHVTWRKHWVVLVEKTLEPLGAILILVAVALIHITGLIPIRIFGSASSSLEVTLAVIAVWFILFFAAAGWAWYQYEDWSNDIYRVTDDRIIDEERSPFGLRTHSIETTLDRVQDVSYVQQGLLANFFQFGDLVIETAGAGRILFKGIVRPTAASQEIFRRRDAHRSRQQVEVARQERREFLDWFMEYHRFLLEQGAIKQAQPKGSFPEEPAAPADSTAAA